MARWQSDSMRKETTHFSIPHFLKEEMDKSGDRSMILNQMLEENMDRIMCGDVEKAAKFKEALVAEKVARYIQGNKDILVLSKDVEDSLQSIFECGRKIESEIDVPYKKLDDLRKKVEKLIQELRRERLAYRKEKEDSLEDFVKSLRDDYEVPVE